MELEPKTTRLVEPLSLPQPESPQTGLVFLFSPWAPELSGTPIFFGIGETTIGWPALVDTARRKEMIACGLSKEHARWLRACHNDSVLDRVEPISAINQTFVNGLPISTATPVVAGDLLRLGDALFSVEADIASFVSPKETTFWDCPRGTDCIVGHSPATRETRRQVSMYGPDTSGYFPRILIEGETGSGKTYVANALHDVSGRTGPCLNKNCAEAQRDTIDSELFGHIKGAYTGATEAKPGWFGQAFKGTLFLDEVHALPLTVQAKLLKVLDSSIYFPVGAGAEEKQANVRIICATNKHLVEEVSHGEFRADLLFRIAQKTITVPPLRERRLDIVEFIRLFVARFARWTTPRSWPTHVSITAHVMEQLLLYGWPGNVRELEQTIARMWVEAGPNLNKKHPIVLAIDKETLTNLSHPVPKKDTPIAEKAPTSPVANPGPPPSRGRRGTRVPLSRESMCTVLAQTNGNVTETARLLNISIDTLYRRIDEYAINLSDYR